MRNHSTRNENRQSKRQTRQLGFEALENRNLLAAEVTIDFEDGLGHQVEIPADHYDGISISNGAWIHPTLPPYVFHDGAFGLGAKVGVDPVQTWAFPGTTKPIVISFDQPTNSVAITAFDIGVNGAQLEAFDEVGNSLGKASVVGSDAGLGFNQTLHVSAPAISRIALTQLFEGAADGVGWDNLVFHSAEVLPDLTPASMAVQHIVTAGTLAEISLIISNSGQANFAGDLAVAYYLSTNELLDDSDIEIGTFIQPTNVSSGGTASRIDQIVVPEMATVGEQYLLAKLDPAGLVNESNESNNDIEAEVTVLRRSGAEWESIFPGSTSLDDLDADFASNVKAFISAVEAGGAHVQIFSTLRPSERAYLMHWSWRIAGDENYPADLIPFKEGVYVDWWHGSQETSKVAAAAMVQAFGIDSKLKVAPALESNHTRGLAIDMAITWEGDLTVIDATGKSRTIKSLPRNSTNQLLIDVASTFGVIHFKNAQKDRNHWSIDGA